MKPGWAEGMFGDHPAGREDGEVAVGSSRNGGRRSEDREDGGIGMVERDRVDAVEASQVVLIRRIIAVPSNDVEG